METKKELSPHARQEMIELQYNRKHIDGYIRDAIYSNPEVLQKIKEGVTYVEYYMSKDYYDSKSQRIEQLKQLDIELLVMDIIVGIAYFQRPELFSSVTAQLAGRLGWDDKPAAVTTVAEIVAMLAHTGLFLITKADVMASLYVESKIPLPSRVIKHIDRSMYLPPMVCKPNTLKNNFNSGYLTHVDSLILGKGNHHSGDICLDVLNLMNSVPLSLCTEFLSKVEEEPTFEITTQEQQEQWDTFKRQSYEIYSLMVNQGNKFYLTHKVDKRGRIYSQGYHINPQGASFKKAQVELANKEVVQGVPEEYQV